jgi:hypothetical protein
MGQWDSRAKMRRPQIAKILALNFLELVLKLTLAISCSLEIDSCFSGGALK